MATIRSCSDVIAERTAYHLVRRAQMVIASYLHFGNGDLSKYLDREAFRELASRLAAHYFHRSKELTIYKQMVELYHAILIMAPILQRLSLSSRYDWHRGHVLSFIRRNASGRIGRYHAAIREVKRSYHPELLAANLELIGIHDIDMVAVLKDLYRRHAAGGTVRDLLAHQLFDPILMMSQKQGFELRYGNRLLRLEQTSFDGSIDLRRLSVIILDFRIKSIEHKGGRHSEICISEECLALFRERINRVIASSTAPEFKLITVERHLRDFVERTRHARSALPQLKELKIWLSNKLRSLAGTKPAANMLPNLLINLWLQRTDSNLYLKKPTFFLDPSAIDEKTYMTFFSPYREV